MSENSIKARPFWQNLIEEAWKEHTIIWLMGVRRVGKTSLCQSLENIEYFDCEQPRIREMLEDFEAFLESKKGNRIILDEIHELDNPSQLLKVAADHYPEVKIIATGSSTLGASAKFRDTLTGRKEEIWLTPMLLDEMRIFGNYNIRHRFLFGGFPFFFTQKQIPEKRFREWIDAYWAKDIQEMFKVNKRASFQKFAELLLASSSGQFEATKFATQCEVDRETINNYLAVLAETFVVHIIRPYSTHKTTEIVSAPKVYGFDTGFVCHAKGWGEIRQEDTGLMWEHCVLNELQGQLQTRIIHYWRDKNGHEIDFVIPNKRNNSITAIECKFSISRIDLAALAKNIATFRYYYSEGDNFIVANDINDSFQRRYEGLTLTFVSPQDLVKKIKAAK